MSSLHRATMALLVGWGLCAGGCATERLGLNRANHEICSPASCFQLGALDSGWSVVHRQTGEVGFYNKSVGGVIQTNAACREDAEAAPLSALTNRLLIGYSDRHERTSELVQLDDREALHTVIDAKLDGVPVTLDLYVLKRDACVFDLSFAAPVARYRDGKADFERFVHGVTVARSD